MKDLFWRYTGLILGLGILFLLDSRADQEISENAAKYLRILEKRPFSTSLFDRFFDAWLESGSIEECRGFLADRAGSEQAKDVDHALLGQFFLRQRSLDEAAEALSQIVDESRTAEVGLKARAWLELARISGQKREFDIGLERLSRAQEAFEAAGDWNAKTELETLQLRGEFLIRTRQAEQAVALWEALLERRGGDSLLREDLVTLLAREGMLDRAIAQQEILAQQARDGELARGAEGQEALAEIEAWLAREGEPPG